MSGVGIGGTLFSIFCGFVFLASGILLIFNAYRFEVIGVPQEFCFTSSILIFGHGVLVVLVGRDQLKGIKEGKDFPVPSSCLWP